MANVPDYTVLLLDPVSLVHLLFSSVTFTVMIELTMHQTTSGCFLPLCQNESTSETILMWKCASLTCSFSCQSNSFLYEKFCTMKQGREIARKWPAVVSKPASMKVAAIALANVYPHALLSRHTWVPIAAFSEIHFTSLARKTWNSTSS